MIALVEHDQCNGCMACAQICPKHCIGQMKDELGNIYPVIDRNICVECGKCVSVCPELQKEEIEFRNIRKAYAVWSVDAESRASSTSGGAAAEFYLNAVNQGYWICGVEYTDDFHVVHTLSKELSGIRKYKQSKYVYSETGEVYRAIRERLNREEKVLFISLPCKVGGLLSYLGKVYENLVTVDIVCHGTPAHQQFHEHIRNVDKMRRAEKLRVRYENEYVFQLIDSDGDIVYSRTGRQDTYLAAFLEGLNYRTSCYSCSYAKPKRISDITICDFWGLGSEKPFNHPYSGAVSAVLINSDKGASFFESCKERFFVEERPIEEAVKGNAQLNVPTSVHPKRELFEKKYIDTGFEVAVKETLCEEMRKDKLLLHNRQIRKILRKMAGIVIPRYRS